MTDRVRDQGSAQGEGVEGTVVIISLLLQCEKTWSWENIFPEKIVFRFILSEKKDAEE